MGPSMSPLPSPMGHPIPYKPSSTGPALTPWPSFLGPPMPPWPSPMGPPVPNNPSCTGPARTPRFPFFGPPITPWLSPLGRPIPYHYISVLHIPYCYILSYLTLGHPIHYGQLHPWAHVIFRATQVNSTSPEPTLDQVRFLHPLFLRFSASPFLRISAFSLTFSFLCLDFLSFTSLTDV
ncbi:hypothetical protein PAXRUDRAFT_177656 [Paxillus rubicundulus Ve08.2h10]|uniref:Uncharacterized protein n=1 Tax=Paxillus rubicundulus Ve08.2h10 TaxID=930991 RepID=A0A0D0BQA3_9AGAM|nr:hypothetical protein PAXRUDRAFT_177656 [Paxillus rubicundulus Ve08.2h10]